MAGVVGDRGLGGWVWGVCGWRGHRGGSTVAGRAGARTEHHTRARQRGVMDPPPHLDQLQQVHAEPVVAEAPGQAAQGVLPHHWVREVTV